MYAVQFQNRVSCQKRDQSIGDPAVYSRENRQKRLLLHSRYVSLLNPTYHGKVSPDAPNTLFDRPHDGRRSRRPSWMLLAGTRPVEWNQ